MDHNVSRHLNFELNEKDWKLMILHYLGLDHVGHIEGPYAPINIRRKLNEMDQVIKKIYTNLNDKDLMIVLSDHGMANEGGHGGSSHMELTTPVLFISKSLFRKNKYLEGAEWSDWMEKIKSNRKQIDLVSTISCLFNLDVPEQNKGVTFINDLTDNFNTDIQELELISLNCLGKNFFQLNSQFGFFEKSSNLIEELNEILQNKSSISTIERFLRDVLDKHVDNKNSNKNQSSFLILFISLMLSVGF